MSARLAQLSVDTKQRADDAACSSGLSSLDTPRLLNKPSPSLLAAKLPLSGRKLHILVVDDSPAIVKLTTMLLKRLGHNTTSAEHGLMATKKVVELWEQRREQFDVILMDLHMPVMDGLEAMKRIRDYEQLQQLEQSGDAASFRHQLIVAMSANADHETSENALTQGADSFMCKPFNVQAFHDTMHAFL